MTRIHFGAVAAVAAATILNTSSASILARQTDGSKTELAGAAAATDAAAAIVARQDDVPTALSDCFLEGDDLFCMAGSTEYSMGTTPTATEDIPSEFTGCHDHGPDLYCFSPDGDDVEASPQEEDEHCHFHSGVEHCVGPNESEDDSDESQCERTDRDYDVPLRVGLLFVVMATSALGVFGPIFLMRYLPPKAHVVIIIIKQFGTGVIISTAFIHLYTHAQLQFQNPCLQGVNFEGTTAAIVMGGLFASFLVEFIGQRIVRAKMAKGIDARSWFRPETVSIIVLEAGILFHSVLIGITLVVAGDSFFMTLFIVIVFHQVFEGLALGSRIAALGTQAVSSQAAQRMGFGHGHDHGHGHGHIQMAPSPTSKGPEEVAPEASTDDSSETLKPPPFSLAKKCLLASAFALITPLGMAIGIGALDHFNGNDQSTILAIGILDAISAGILIWVGVVEMWAEDWMFGSSELMNAGWIVTGLSMFGLMAGMALMGFLGLWA